MSEQQPEHPPWRISVPISTLSEELSVELIELACEQPREIFNPLLELPVKEGAALLASLDPAASENGAEGWWEHKMTCHGRMY